jgi:hypothetical protein
VLAGIVVAVRQPRPLFSGPLTLPDGEVVRVVGVTYGTNHLVGRPLARAVAHLPAGAQAVLKRLLGRRALLEASTTTSEPRLIVWLARATNNGATPPIVSYLSALLSDSSGFISGDSAPFSVSWPHPAEVSFQVFPRRDPAMALNFFYHSPTGGVIRGGSLPVANPVHGKFPQWQPEPLPATRRAGDVAVTLDNLSTGHNGNTTYRSVPGGGGAIEFGTNGVNDPNETVCAVHFHPLTNTNEVWVVAGEEVSDATGNRARYTRLGLVRPEDGYFTFEPGLWPKESAWKLRCEIKRAKGFAADETFVFRDVPLGGLGETNRLGWTTNFAGVTVTLDQIIRRTPTTGNDFSWENKSQVQFSTRGLTNGVHLDLVSARTDTGTMLESPLWSSGGNQRTYRFRTLRANGWDITFGFRNLPADARSAAFTFAVQHSRWVEFMVKPEAGPLSIEYKPER